MIHELFKELVSFFSQGRVLFAAIRVSLVKELIVGIYAGRTSKVRLPNQRSSTPPLWFPIVPTYEKSD
jgi:hypothetical protein